MIDAEFANDFARAWVQAWNDHDLEAVLEHYADEIVFHSPRIRTVTGKDVDLVAGKAALHAYWAAALDKAPGLFFEIDRVLVGSDSLTILYANHRSQQVAETFVFQADGLVVRSIAAYAA